MADHLHTAFFQLLSHLVPVGLSQCFSRPSRTFGKSVFVSASSDVKIPKCTFVKFFFHLFETIIRQKRRDETGIAVDDCIYQVSHGPVG